MFRTAPPSKVERPPLDNIWNILMLSCILGTSTGKNVIFLCLNFVAVSFSIVLLSSILIADVVWMVCGGVGGVNIILIISFIIVINCFLLHHVL